MPQVITDERTLAAWLAAPTQARAAAAEQRDEPSLFQYADVEEHVKGEDGGTKRCDITVRSQAGPLFAAELKRPEVLRYDHPDLLADARKKAIARGFELYATCDFADVALWRTDDGDFPSEAVIRHPLASELAHSSGARARRSQIETEWAVFLDLAEVAYKSHHDLDRTAPMPPQIVDLRRAIEACADVSAVGIELRLSTDVAQRREVLECFVDQFGVELSLDPDGAREVFERECRYIAGVSCFVVTMRLLLHRALSTGTRAEGWDRPLAEIVLSPEVREADRLLHHIRAELDYAREATGDFDVQLRTTLLDEIAFFPNPAELDVASPWKRLVEEVNGADWTGPTGYVPVLYESLLDEHHRHQMGVHYTPEPLAEVIAAYAIRGPADGVLDPSSGAGTFLSVAYERKKQLGSNHQQSLAETYGVEIASFAASLAGLSLSLSDRSAASAYPKIVEENFFRTFPGFCSGVVRPDGELALPDAVDAFIGNPPYVRQEGQTAEHDDLVHDLLAKEWLARRTAFPNFTGKADLWAHFIAHGHSFLRPGGRIGLVLSWSLLASTYGDAVLQFISRHYRVDVVLDSMVERFFEAEQNTLILLATKLDPMDARDSGPNPSLDSAAIVRFVRLKRPLERLLEKVERGKRAESLIGELMKLDKSSADDSRWNVRVFSQLEIS